MLDLSAIEDYLFDRGFQDVTIGLALGSYSGGREILKEYPRVDKSLIMKDDGSPVGILEYKSEQTISDYISSSGIGDKCKFISEEGITFPSPGSYEFAGIFDGLDGSRYTNMGGESLRNIGVGGVIHRISDDAQIAASIFMPFDNEKMLYLAEKGKGAYTITINHPENNILITKISLPKTLVIENTLIESEALHKNLKLCRKALDENGFYDPFKRRLEVTAGMSMVVRALKGEVQAVLQTAPSHQADFCWLLMEEAGADVIAQDGNRMHSTSYAMLSISPSFNGDKYLLIEKYVDAMKSDLVGGKYMGWNPDKVILRNVL